MTRNTLQSVEQLAVSLDYSLIKNTSTCYSLSTYWGYSRTFKTLKAVVEAINTGALLSAQFSPLPEDIDQEIIDRESAKEEVLNRKPTQTSFQEIAAIFDANNWGMTPEQEIRFHEDHWLVLPEKTEHLTGAYPEELELEGSLFLDTEELDYFQDSDFDSGCNGNMCLAVLPDLEPEIVFAKGFKNNSPRVSAKLQRRANKFRQLITA